MSELNQEELLKILGDSIEEGRRNIRDLKGSLDISQDEFDERFYKLNQAEDQIRKMIKKREVTEEWITAKAFLLQGAANNFVALRQSLTKTFKEAGMEIISK